MLIYKWQLLGSNWSKVPFEPLFREVIEYLVVSFAAAVFWDVTERSWDCVTPKKTAAKETNNMMNWDSLFLFHLQPTPTSRFLLSYFGAVTSAVTIAVSLRYITINRYIYIPKNHQHPISPYNINTLSRIQMLRIKKLISCHLYLEWIKKENLLI